METLLKVLNNTLLEERGLYIKLVSIENTTPSSLCNVTSPPDDDSDDEIDAFIYIVIVILFYAFSIVILMVKYMRQEAENARLEAYYLEFVKRDKIRLCYPFSPQHHGDRKEFAQEEAVANEILPVEGVGDENSTTERAFRVTDVWKRSFVFLNKPNTRRWYEMRSEEEEERTSID